MTDKKLGQENSVKRHDGEWWVEQEAGHFILIRDNGPIEDVIGEFTTPSEAWADLMESDASANAEKHYRNQEILAGEGYGN